VVPAQWEVSNRAYDVLKNTTDAKGRKIEVCKIRLPPPQFRNYREAEGLAVSPSGLTVVSSKHNNRMHPAACAVTNNVPLRPSSTQLPITSACAACLVSKIRHCLLYSLAA
jgi:hypothetical protein